ncbi:CBS domain-containing protein [Vibrio scophthalmi]|uniref:Inosine monophosphate dehydrogenase-like protein n=2 Tax=Vibrio scophthalmi TaxID=45658 RepID=F9RKX7_9VIBR|nr:CBS domain-containing protein [Vibrio scophthalmi]ANU37070.1 IMP dehydrogenase [Vibrio scophthalmi]EGU39321.1 inosine monophosphate dehydrogenase-like protein [Vibrio scophthalmi LMG 19158]MCY9802205.1 CBS domain-containing protein [Vibrio scophthalmi]
MESLKVRDYMTLQAVTFNPEMSLSAALDKVMDSDYLGGPVINEQKQVIGFLSGQDLLDKLIKVSYFCQDTHIVSDCMSSEVLSVSPDMSIIELADMMQIGKPKVYPVLDNGKLVGIITRKHVLRAIAKNIDACFKHPV